ncbi:MAG: RNA polymerase subunit sigma-70 [Bacteroidetes bacterium HGW-Bacteroidetes-6]|jgi:RNA polymerase sigma-70 factor (ECF subfamily)|nr:MAG: RNA polymerase subunit sigma-70 [Bacteroidetes bacterium HGW-Bacteroidetes-6]
MDIAAIKKGDKKAFRVLIDSTHRDVYRLAFRFTANNDDAQDVSQEVFLDAWRNIDKFREEADIKTWLYRITVNKSLNLIKRNKNKFSSVSISDSGDFETTSFQIPALPSYSADKPLDNKELRILLNRALEKIPENQRTAFLLFNSEGLSYNQIAEVMETTLGAVESLIFRAKANLRKILAEVHKQFSESAQVLK